MVQKTAVVANAGMRAAEVAVSLGQKRAAQRLKTAALDTPAGELQPMLTPQEFAKRHVAFAVRHLSRCSRAGSNHGRRSSGLRVLPGAHTGGAQGVQLSSLNTSAVAATLPRSSEQFVSGASLFEDIPPDFTKTFCGWALCRSSDGGRRHCGAAGPITARRCRPHPSSRAYGRLMPFRCDLLLPLQSLTGPAGSPLAAH